MQKFNMEGEYCAQTRRAGDSPVRGNVRVSEKGCRNPEDSCSRRQKHLHNPVGAGFHARPSKVRQEKPTAAKKMEILYAS